MSNPDNDSTPALRYVRPKQPDEHFDGWHMVQEDVISPGNIIAYCDRGWSLEGVEIASAPPNGEVVCGWCKRVTEEAQSNDSTPGTGAVPDLEAIEARAVRVAKDTNLLSALGGPVARARVRELASKDVPALIAALRASQREVEDWRGIADKLTWLVIETDNKLRASLERERVLKGHKCALLVAMQNVLVEAKLCRSELLTPEGFDARVLARLEKTVELVTGEPFVSLDRDKFLPPLQAATATPGAGDGGGVRDREKLRDALEEVLYQFAHEGTKNGVPVLTTGGLSPLEQAFEAMGWPDPYPIPKPEQQAAEREAKRLPTTEEIGGSDPDFTGGKSTEEFVREMREGQEG